MLFALWRCHEQLRSRPAGPKAPALQLPRYPLSLRNGEPGQELAGTFKLRNDGGAPLEFRLKPGCGGCTKCSPAKGTISPGETTEIEVAIKLANNSGTSRRVDIAVTTNDPARATAVYHVMADCPAPFSVEPPVIQFGSVPFGADQAARERAIIIRPIPVTRARMASQNDIAIEKEAPWMTVERDDVGDEGAQRLTVSLADHIPPGYFSGTVRIRRVDRPRQFVDVKVEGEMVGVVVVSPANLRLTCDPMSEEIAGNLRHGRFRDARVPRPHTLIFRIGQMAAPLSAQLLANEYNKRFATRVQFVGDEELNGLECVRVRIDLWHNGCRRREPPARSLPAMRASVGACVDGTVLVGGGSGGRRRVALPWHCHA